jgi:hypothetical protein
MTMGAFLSIALYNVIETTFLIFAVFKHRKGLYFWSFLVATWGIAPHAIGFTIKFFQVSTLDLLSSVIIGVGWACMVIGQSVVLYSRLHLVVRDKTRIRWVLYMIVFNGVVLGIPLFTLAMGANSKYSPRFLPGFLVYDKITIVVVAVQETIISLLYIYETTRLLADCSGNHDSSTSRPLRNLLRHLFLVNIVVLIFDISLLSVQFSGHYEIQTTYKSAVYSVKLKIEFSVLNRLVAIVTQSDLLTGRATGGGASHTFSLTTWTQSAAGQGVAGAFVTASGVGAGGKRCKSAPPTHVEHEEVVGVSDDAFFLALTGNIVKPDSIRSTDAILSK